MNKTQEALKLALEALRANQPINYCMNNNGETFPLYAGDPFRVERNEKAIAAIEEVLTEQPAQQQEPVGYFKQKGKGIWWQVNDAYRDSPGVVALYTSTNPEKQQEPVSWRNAALRVGEDLCSVGPFGYYDMTAEQWLDWALSVVTVHAPPASKPLTDETTQIVKRYNYMMHPDYFEVYDEDSRYPYRVGIQPKVEKGFGKSINECIQGRGATLEEALDRAIEAAHGIKGDA